MSNHNWYRKVSWSADDEADFFARLNRARASSRSQYLRIQAAYLEEVKTRATTEAALNLLDLLLHEYPDIGEITAAYLQRARCLEFLGRLLEAEDAYRNSLKYLREFPNVKPPVHVEFAFFVIRHKKKKLYKEALEVMDEFTGMMFFPLEIYNYSTAKALLLARLGRRGEARLFAIQALEECKKDKSGLRYHPDLGLVKNPDPMFHKELKKLAKQ